MMEYLDMMAEFTVFLMIPLSVEMSLQERITEYLQRKEKEELLPVLIFPEKENMNTVEQKSFLQLVEESRAGTLTDPMIQDHINAYGALSVRYGIGTFWTIEDVRRRIGNFEEDPAAMLQELKEQVEENRKQTAEALDELDAPDDIRSLVKLIKEYVYLRTYRSTVLSNSYVYAQPIFERVAAERGLSYQELNFCAYHEVLDDAIPSKEELARRQEGYSAIAQKPRLKIVTGKGIEEMRTFYGLDIDTEGITTVEGISTYPGTIQGTAKIVRSNEVLDKVKRGDILIASMTTPDFIPAMEKAAAFVTDEGGILCHAAIVARELKKTCVIGTKHATKVFKDGDLIEVDADKGTVKKVE
ncbi:hypothetical protein GOV07_02035 [Candidatus Woesearchaeota archaeon]|nr:hypothetical protein [Candidatus Woesearchaeota archaeon]